MTNKVYNIVIDLITVRTTANLRSIFLLLSLDQTGSKNTATRAKVCTNSYKVYRK